MFNTNHYRFIRMDRLANDDMSDIEILLIIIIN